MASRIYVAIETFSFALDGNPVIVHAGQTVREGHPILKAVPGHFVPLVEHVDFEVEQASAAPGEKRKVGRPKLPRDENGNIVREGGEG